MFQKTIRRAAAVLLAAAMAAALPACEAEPAPVDAALEIGGEYITETEFCYQLLSVISTYEYYSGAIDWSSEINGMSPAQYFKEEAVESILLFRAVERLAEELEISLDEADLAEVEEQIAYEKELAGGEEAYLASLEANALDAALFRYLLEVSQLYNKMLYALYGEDGAEYLTDEEVRQSFREEYIHATHILLSFTDDNGAALTADEIAAQRQLAEELLERARGGEDFASLVEQYGQDTGLEGIGTDSGYEQGYYFNSTQMVQEFYDAAAGLEEGEISGIVETLYGCHIIKRLPMEDSYLEDNLEYFREELSYSAYDKKLNKAKDGLDVKTLEPYETVDPEEIYGRYLLDA